MSEQSSSTISQLISLYNQKNRVEPVIEINSSLLETLMDSTREDIVESIYCGLSLNSRKTVEDLLMQLKKTLVKGFVDSLSVKESRLLDINSPYYNKLLWHGETLDHITVLNKVKFTTIHGIDRGSCRARFYLYREDGEPTTTTTTESPPCPVIYRFSDIVTNIKNRRDKETASYPYIIIDFTQQVPSQETVLSILNRLKILFVDGSIVVCFFESIEKKTSLEKRQQQEQAGESCVPPLAQKRQKVSEVYYRDIVHNKLRTPLQRESLLCSIEKTIPGLRGMTSVPSGYSKYFFTGDLTNAFKSIDSYSLIASFYDKEKTRLSISVTDILTRHQLLFLQFSTAVTTTGLL